MNTPGDFQCVVKKNKTVPITIGKVITQFISKLIYTSSIVYYLLLSEWYTN